MTKIEFLSDRAKATANIFDYYEVISDAIMDCVDEKEDELIIGLRGDAIMVTPTISQDESILIDSRLCKTELQALCEEGQGLLSYTKIDDCMLDVVFPPQKMKSPVEIDNRD